MKYFRMTKLLNFPLSGFSILSRLYLDCFVYFDTSTCSVHRFALQPPRNDGVTSFVIASGAKQSRRTDNVRLNKFFIIRVITMQVAVIASGAKQSRLSRLSLDCFVPRNDGTCSTSLRGTKQSRDLDSVRVNDFVIIIGAKQSRLSHLSLDCFLLRVLRHFDISISSMTVRQAH